MGLNNLLVTAGYQLAPQEELTNAILNLMAKPTVNAAITDPVGTTSYWRNGNFYSGFWTTPAGVTAATGTETVNAANWTVNPLGASVTYKQSTVVPDNASVYSLQIVGNTGTTDVRLSQTLSPDFSGVLRAGNVSVSGYIQNNTPGVFTPVLEVWSCNSLGNFTTTTLRSSTSMQTCPAAGAWTFVSVSLSLNVTNALNGLRISIKIPTGSLAANTSSVNFSRLQLQTGSVATPFLDDISLFATLPTITNSNLATPCVSMPNLDSTVQSFLVPTGTLLDFASLTAPSGFLVADGSAVSRTATATAPLFAVMCGMWTGNMTAGSPTVTNLTFVSGTSALAAYPISGTGIPSGTTILSLTGTGPFTATLSKNATAPGTGVALVVAPYGVGDGSTTYNLPDTRGRSTIGYNQGSLAGLTNRLLGIAGGEETHTLTTAEIPAHSHTITDPGHNHTLTDPGHTHTVSDPTHFHGYTGPGSIFGAAAGGATTNLFGSTNATATSASATGISIVARVTGISIAAKVTGITATNASTGGGGAHNTMMPFVVAQKIIKT